MFETQQYAHRSYRLQLSESERRDALEVAGAASGRPLHLLEKDVWVVWALETLFGSRFGADLVFKGGTSLSKAYGVIHRFSEDVDLPYDIRAIAPDLTAGEPEALTASRNQAKKWSDEIRSRLTSWVREEMLPLLEAAFSSGNLPARVSAVSAGVKLTHPAG